MKADKELAAAERRYSATAAAGRAAVILRSSVDPLETESGRALAMLAAEAELALGVVLTVGVSNGKLFVYGTNKVWTIEPSGAGWRVVTLESFEPSGTPIESTSFAEAYGAAAELVLQASLETIRTKRERKPGGRVVAVNVQPGAWRFGDVPAPGEPGNLSGMMDSEQWKRQR